MYVTVLDADGVTVDSQPTNASGAYMLRLPGAGSYFVYTDTSAVYFNEVHDNIRCATGDCTNTEVLAGTPVVAVQDADVTVNFLLDKAGSISGTITSAAGPIDDAFVIVVSAAGESVNFSASREDGTYTTFDPLVPGTYYLYTEADGFLAEYYDNVLCGVFCSTNEAVARGTPIVVAAGAAVTGIDVVLAPSGRIRGRVTASDGAPLESVNVYAYDLDGAEADHAFTDEDGGYDLDGLTGGAYRVFTNSGTHQNEVWSDVPCGMSCSNAEVSGGTPITVAAGEVVAGRDFVLVAGGRITGTITDATSGVPIPDVEVYVVAGGEFVTERESREDGTYTIANLPAGSYALLTDAGSGYLDEYFDNVPCPGLDCSFSRAERLATPVAVTLGGTSTANFALNQGGRITGTLTDSATGAPIADALVYAVRTTDGGMQTPPGRFTDSSGVYTLIGLPAGSWHVFTSNQKGYINEIHPDLPCPGYCPNARALSGTPIAVTIGATVPGIDFALAPGGRVAGTVTDATTSAPLANQYILIYDQHGQYVTEGQTGASGEFASFDGLQTGTYHAWLDAYYGYLSELFPNIPCGTDCFTRRAAGNPIAVTVGATTTGTDFALDRGGVIRGRVIREQTGLPSNDTTIRIVDAAGRRVDSGFTQDDGTWETNVGLPTGTYYAFTDNDEGLVDEIYANRPCPSGCAISQATGGMSIAVTVGQETTGIDFALATAIGVPQPPEDLFAVEGRGGVLIRWEPSDLGVRPTSYLLDAGLAPGTTALTIPVTGTSYLASGVPPGRYFVRVRGVNAAGAGPASSEIEMVVAAAHVVAPGEVFIDDMEMVGRKLILTWDPNFTGGPPVDYVIEAGSATGLADIARIVVTQTQFTYEPVPDGFYFLRVYARNAAGLSPASHEEMLVVGNVPAPPAAPGSPSATVSGLTVTLSWFAPAGPVTGYIVEAGFGIVAVEPRCRAARAGDHGQLHGDSGRHLLRARPRLQRAGGQRGVRGDRDRGGLSGAKRRPTGGGTKCRFDPYAVPCLPSTVRVPRRDTAAARRRGGPDRDDQRSGETGRRRSAAAEGAGQDLQHGRHPGGRPGHRRGRRVRIRRACGRELHRPDRGDRHLRQPGSLRRSMRRRLYPARGAGGRRPGRGHRRGEHHR